MPPFTRLSLAIATAILALEPGPLGTSRPAPIHAAALSMARCPAIHYQVQSQSGAGPFAPANDPSIPRPLFAQATFAYLNVGAAMPHFVLQLNTRRTWRAGALSVSLDTGHRKSAPPARVVHRAWPHYTWDLGPFPAGAVLRVSIAMHLSRNHYMTFVQTYGDVGPDGRPSTAAVVEGGGQGSSGGSGN